MLVLSAVETKVPGYFVTRFCVRSTALLVGYDGAGDLKDSLPIVPGVKSLSQHSLKQCWQPTSEESSKHRTGETGDGELTSTQYVYNVYVHIYIYIYIYRIYIYIIHILKRHHCLF